MILITLSASMSLMIFFMEFVKSLRELWPGRASSIGEEANNMSPVQRSWNKINNCDYFQEIGAFVMILLCFVFVVQNPDATGRVSW